MLALPVTVGSPYTHKMRTLFRSVQSQIYVTLMNTSYADNGRAMLYNVSFAESLSNVKEALRQSYRCSRTSPTGRTT